MDPARWRTVASFTTRFEAQMAADRLDDALIGSRILSDSANETMPHVAFGTGGHRVQVAGDDEDVARRLLDEQPEPDPDPDGVDPTVPRRLRRGWVRLLALVVSAAFVAAVVLSFRPLLV